MAIAYFEQKRLEYAMYHRNPGGDAGFLMALALSQPLQIWYTSQR